MRDRFDTVVQLQQRFMVSPYDEWFPEKEVPEVLTELGSIGILTLNRRRKNGKMEIFGTIESR